MSFVGRNLSSGEHLKLPLSAAITPALLTLVMSLPTVLTLAQRINGLAPIYSG